MAVTYESLFEAIKVELQKNPEDYTSLMLFAKKKFKNKVNRWCQQVETKVGSDMEDDLFQEICVDLCKGTKRRFFCKDDTPFDTTKTLYEFQAWTKTVGVNALKKFIAKNSFWDMIVFDNPLGFSENPDEGDDEGSFVDTEDTTDDFEATIERDYFSTKLSKAIRIVFDLKTEPHMVLSWLAVSIVIAAGAYERHEAGKVVDAFFKDDTLYEMFDYIIPLMKNLDWFKISDDELNEQRARLDAVHEKTGKPIGEMKFCEFYQKKGGRASISEWFTRTSGQVTKKID